LKFVTPKKERRRILNSNAKNRTSNAFHEYRTIKTIIELSMCFARPGFRVLWFNETILSRRP